MMGTSYELGDMDGEGSKERLNAYIYDFLVKSAMHRSAQVFFEESGLRESTNSGDKKRRAIINSSRSYLYELWQIFWGLFAVRDKRNAEPTVQAYYDSWNEKNIQQSELMAQEIQAASLQQLCEDAGNYGDDEVDASKLALVANNIPLHPNFQDMSSKSPNGVIKPKKRRTKLEEEYRDRFYQDLPMSHSTCAADKNLMPHRVVENAGNSHSQELPTPFEFQNFESDYPIFPGTAALPLDFPPITGEDSSFLDNNNGRTFNFLDGV